MTAFPAFPYEGQVYTIGTRSWTYSEVQDGWILNKNGPTGPTGTQGPTGPMGVLLTSLTVDTFTGDGLSTSFTLSIVPQSVYNMIVDIDGLVQTANVNYGILGSNIIFTTAPLNGASITVVHFITGSAIPGPTGAPGLIGPTGPRTGLTGPPGPTGPAGNGLLSVSGFVNAGTFVTLDNIKATVTSSGNRGLSIAAVSGSFDVLIFGTYGYTSGGSGSSTSGTINTSPSNSIFGWNFATAGDGAIFIITDITNNRSYRITMQINSSYNNNLISIERVI